MNDYFLDRRARIEQYLARLAAGPHALAPLRAPVERALRSTGKRVRGVLLLAAGDACGARQDALLPAAAAIEMIHTSSLILDDLPSMDNAMLRRGQPSLHREFGEDLAILAAVSLLNHAYGLIATNHAVTKPKRWPLDIVIGRVVEAVGWNGTIGGEAVDLHADPSRLDFETLEVIHSRKTGALFGVAAALGVMLSNGNDLTRARTETYAKNLGLAFQITDDVLDVTSTAEALGKDVQQDQERLSFVKLAGVEGARNLSRELVDTSLASIASMGAAAGPLRDLAVLVRDRVS